MLPPVPRCSGWAYSSLISPGRSSLPRFGGRVGLHIDLFEACSAFRGRDGHCWPPPAQIRTCPIKASDSYLGCLTSKRASQLFVRGSLMGSAAEEPMVRRLCAGGKRIRTASPSRERVGLSD